MNNNLKGNSGDDIATDNADISNKGVPTPLEQPWFKEAYKAALQFYEKDEALDSNDRIALSEAYRSIAKSQMIGGWLGFSAVFIPPFAYKFYKTNDMRGVKVPRNFALALLALFGTTIIAGNIGYNNQLKRLDPDGVFERDQAAKSSSTEFEPDLQSQQIGVEVQQKSPEQRQFEMMSLLKNGSATKWASYFYITEKQPEKRLPNPAVKLQEIQQRGLRRSSYMNQRDPIGLYEDIPEKDRYKMREPAKMNHDPDASKPPVMLTSTPNETNSTSTMPIQTTKQANSSWDRVRQHESQLNSNRENDDDGFELFPDSTSSLASIPLSASERSVSEKEFQKLLDKERNGGD